MSDKVRFYLEQSVAELEDLRKKELFTKQELAVIMRKRTDHEHRISGRTVKPRDFLKYAEYEINVERLRKKRVKRLGNKDVGGKSGISDWAGPRRIMFIFDRSTKRFPGEIQLWLQYLEYAKQQKAIHVINKIFTTMLQLHPTKPKLWILAAKHESDENASMKAARYILQRSLRFNYDSELLWYEYIKLELIYVSKILARRKLLGLDLDTEEQQAQKEQDEEDEESEAHIELPDIKEQVKDDLKALPEADMSMLGNPQTNPALRGDVALAIYDASMERAKTVDAKYDFSLKIIELFDSFIDLDRAHLSKHVIDYLSHTQASPKTLFLSTTLPVRYVSHDDPTFPDMIKLMITKYNKSLSLEEKTPELKQHLREFLTSKYLEPTLEPALDQNIRLVLQSFTKKL
ncbi:Utp6p [Sugiyamaella lignohabitans]|uniref:mRNA 3'-end-processing protein RNA14 n=1 Tax=Sugiyamaella lignohabitans TaxID=796027 RepID=A0A167E8H7_9ASCO|nr:Utp6p [Sugiyamaella lignohabitans]ANB13771.1 Utp6p [Sugiyamaella lignohabitans]